MRLSRWILLPVVVGLALVGCKGGVTSIKTLLDDPSSYDHKTVRIIGDVTGSIGAMGYGAYTVSDGTGTIPIVTNTGGAPRDGAKVGVEGEFRAAYTLGDKSGAVIIEKKRKVE